MENTRMARMETYSPELFGADAAFHGYDAAYIDEAYEKSCVYQWEGLGFKNQAFYKGVPMYSYNSDGKRQPRNPDFGPFVPGPYFRRGMSDGSHWFSD